MRTLTASLDAAQRDSHATWAATHAYSLNGTVVPTIQNGRSYICTTEGTSGGTEPTWPTTTGNTVGDGSIVWTDNGKRGDVLCKIVLTSGATEKIYGVDTTNRLLKVTHSEQPYSQTAKVLVDNRDNNLSSLSLEGYQGVISYGFKTRLGDEYSATAPLKVKAQELLSAGGQLVCQFDLFGLPDQMASDKALTSYTQDSTDTNTIKTLITAIAGATLACYSHCAAITINWDTGYDDDIIDDFCPKDSFHISVGESRLAKIRELLGYTKCVMRFEDDGQLHILQPTITGTTYDYQYHGATTSGMHNFFSKIYRTRLVLPNRYVIKNADNPADVETYLSGEATSAASYALLPKTEPKILRLASDAEGTRIATAMIQRAELDHERGSGFAPMNVGQEDWDYVIITDPRENDDFRIGNIGYLTRNYQPGQFNFYFGFGDILLQASLGLGGVSDQPFVTYAEFTDTIAGLRNDMGNTLTLVDALTSILEQWGTSVPKWHITYEARCPVI